MLVRARPPDMGLFRPRRKELEWLPHLSRHDRTLAQELLAGVPDPVLRQSIDECLRGTPFHVYYDIARHLRDALAGIEFCERHLYLILGAVRIMRHDSGYQVEDLRPMMLSAVESVADDPDRWREIWLTIAHATSFTAAELAFAYGVPAEYLEAMAEA